ncbi:ATP-binding cassette sub-family A member 17 [Trichonephila clavipes]|nr:ATP-binding cassette sub-family A member 17 [Trichonephila clavipes]
MENNISNNEQFLLLSAVENICESQNNCLVPKDIITWDVTGIGHDLSFLFINGCINFGILLLLETELLVIFLSNVMSLWKSMIGQVIEGNTKELDVVTEEERIRNLVATHLQTSAEALVVSRLTKFYRNCNAVNCLTFGVHPEECFGLLGVNGAGKTTVFKMLSADTFPTDGNANIASFTLRKNLKKFCSHVGYCHTALIDHLTGREMLILLARLRGLTGSHLQEQVNSLIQITDLTAYADNQIQLYSGGNKKKLSVALSVIGSPPLILLDEPTAELDPVSRQKIWNLLCQVRSKGSALILITHSIEEIEALCNRLAFMVNGHFCCLGTIQDLKPKYGQSYSVTIKIRRDQDNQETMDTIKNYLQIRYTVSNLKEYQDIIRCHVVGANLQELKTHMSEMKNLHNDGLLDLLITDSSLEQIHL